MQIAPIGIQDNPKLIVKSLIRKLNSPYGISTEKLWERKTEKAFGQSLFRLSSLYKCLLAIPKISYGVGAKECK